MVAVIIQFFRNNLSAFFSGSSLQIGPPRRPAQVTVSSFDVRNVSGSRARSGEDLIHTRSTIMGRIFGFSIFVGTQHGFSLTTRPTDLLRVLRTQGLFSNAAWTSLFVFFVGG